MMTEIKQACEVPTEVIENRQEFQNNRVPQICEEFDLKKVVVEPNRFNYDGVITIAPIEFSAKCGHHLVGIHGKAYFAYIPDKQIIGLSMSARIIEYFLNVTKEILQEEANKQIVDFFQEKLKPKGVWLILNATHECMSARGVRQRSSRTSTSDMRGVFHTDFALRDETKYLWEIGEK
jgi:GTP cyclohydrolase I